MPFSGIVSCRAVRLANRRTDFCRCYRNKQFGLDSSPHFQRDIETRATMVITFANCGDRFMIRGLVGGLASPRRADPADGRFDLYVPVYSLAQYKGAGTASTREKEGRHDHQGHYRSNTSHH